MEKQWDGKNVAQRWIGYGESSRERQAVSFSVLKCNSSEELLERVSSVQPYLPPLSFQIFLDQVYTHMSARPSYADLLPLMQERGWEMGEIFWSHARRMITEEMRSYHGLSSGSQSLAKFLKNVSWPSSFGTMLGQYYRQKPSWNAWKEFKNHPCWKDGLKWDKHAAWSALNDKVKTNGPTFMWKYAQEEQLDAKTFIRRLINLGTAEEVGRYLYLVVAGLDEFGVGVLTPSRQKMLYDRLKSQEFPLLNQKEREVYDRLLVHLSRISIDSHVNHDRKTYPSSSKRKI